MEWSLLLHDIICSECITIYFQLGGNLSLVTLTFDLDIQTRPSEGPNMSSMWIWHNSIQSIQQFLRHFIPHHHNRFTALFRDHPGKPVPEENVWTLSCKGRLTEADTPTIRLAATPSGLVTSAHLHHPHIFYRPDALPATQPTASKHRDISYTNKKVTDSVKNRTLHSSLRVIKSKMCFLWKWSTTYRNVF